MPGDLGGHRVDDRFAAHPQVLERAEELVAAAVAAADRAHPRVAPAVLLDPAELADQGDQASYVGTLEGGVLDVGDAAGLAPAALVVGEHAVPGIEELADAGRAGGARAAPAVAVQQHRHLPRRRGAGRPEQGVADLDLGLAARLRDALDAAVGDRDRGSRSRCGGYGGQRGREQGGAEQGDQAGSHAGTNRREGPKLLARHMPVSGSRRPPAGPGRRGRRCRSWCG